MYDIHRYLNATKATQPQFGREGSIYFISDHTGVPQLFRSATTWPQQLTFAQNRVMSFQCSPVDSRVLYGHDVGGNENQQIYLLDPDTGEEHNLTIGYEHAMHLNFKWTPDGVQIVFAANRRDKGLFDLFTQKIGSKPVLLWEQIDPGFLYIYDISPDGRYALINQTISSDQTNFYEVDLQSGVPKRLSDDKTPAVYLAAKYSPNDDSIYLVTDQGSNYQHIIKHSRSTGEETIHTEIEWDIEQIALSVKGLTYVANVDGVSHLYRDNKQLVVPEGVISDLTNDLESGRIAFTLTTPTQPHNACTFEAESDVLLFISQSSHGGIPTERFIQPERIYYPTFDMDEAGRPRQVPALLYRPQTNSDQPAPVIVYVHGGPASQFRPEFYGWMQYLIHNGYAILAPNVRGSTGYGRTYMQMDDVEKRMDSVADLAHAAHWLKAQPEFDGDQIVVYGRSYGGFMVLSAMTTYPELWVAGIEFVGISNWVTFLENTSDYRRPHREAEYGRLEHDRKFLQAISPLNHIKKIKVPLLVFHGANDPRVPLSEAEQLVKALTDLGVPVEFKIFADEGHQFVKLKTHLEVYPMILDFLNRYVNQ